MSFGNWTRRGGWVETGAEVLPMKFFRMVFILGRRKRPVAAYTGDMMNELFATVDRALWRSHLL
jgi:hypothetical protein